MSGAAIGEALCRLAGEARRLRDRDVSELLASLGELLETWRDPRSPWRLELERELPSATGFSPEVVTRGLTRALETWTADALGELVRNELGSRAPYGSGPGHAIGFETTAVLLAGSIPMPTIQALLLPLLLRSPVLAKTASRDSITARLFAKSLEQVDPELGRCIEVVDFGSNDREAVRAMLRAPCVVAYGSDETIGSLRTQVDASQRFVPYGHRMSLAVVGGLADEREVSAELALDLALWDQLGCLSPAALYVVGEEPQLATRIASRLAEAMEELGKSLPRGEFAPATQVQIAHARSEAELRAASSPAMAVHAGAQLSYTVVLETDARWRPTPLHRFLRVHPVPTRAALQGALRPLTRHLSTVAIAGHGSDEADVASDLMALGASRICRPGQMQTPPLDWRHDGQSPLLPLAQLSDLEL